jgi:hypothetical protein
MHKYTEKPTETLSLPPDFSALDTAIQIAKSRITRKKLDAASVSRAAARRQQNAADAAANPAYTQAEIDARKAFSTGELQLNTLDVKPPPSDKHSEKAIKLRSQCFKVGKTLIKRGVSKPALLKSGKKISNCRVVGLFQEVSPTCHYKVGAALCKQRLCPNCQRVLSAKRKQNTLAWFDLNRDQLRKYFYYHMVLTVPHSEAEGVRTGLYVSEILESFAKLRGTAKGMPGKVRERVSKWWNSWIAGGFYHVETIPAKSDNTAHTHVHIVVVAKKQLWNAAKKSTFMQQVEPRWALLTKNDKLFKGVFVDPVYYIDEETKKRVNCHFGSSMRLEAAVSEAAKYTMKADTETLDGFTDEFLEDMLTTKNRYYGRFGCLNAKDSSSKQFQKLDMLCTDFKDLEQVSAVEARRLFNPETGEIVDKEATRLLVTPFRNMRQTETAGWVEGSMEEGKARTNKQRVAGEKMVIGEMVYALEKEVGYTSYYSPDDKAKAMGRMSMSLENEYDPNLDIIGYTPSSSEPYPSEPKNRFKYPKSALKSSKK